MSVLKSKRLESKAEFVNTAMEIDSKTVNFASRLSARYARLIGARIAKLSGKLAIRAVMANRMPTDDDEGLRERKKHLLKALAALAALDTQLTRCYQILMENPQGAFTNRAGQTIDASKANKRLDNMAQSLGELIDKENGLLKGQLNYLKNLKK